MRGVRDARWVVEIIPQVRLTEAFALNELQAASEVVIGVEVARDGLKTGNGNLHGQGQHE
jgi:hypothetical protein